MNMKDLKKDSDKITDKYEEIIKYLESVYAGRPKKKEKEIKEIPGNFKEIAERKDTVRKKVKQANEAIEEARNEDVVKIRQKKIKK